MGKASAEKRRVVVYVGATWCEPCQRFHQAAERASSTRRSPTSTSSYSTPIATVSGSRRPATTRKLIPLFALPGADGTASGKQIEGGIKGDGAVACIAPRLEKMLAE